MTGIASHRTPTTIRPATVTDAPGIAEAHVASWRSTYTGIIPQAYLDALNVEEFADRWRTRLAEQPDLIMYVAERDGAIRGFASGGSARQALEQLPAELYAIYLPAPEQRRGTGSRLFWSVAQALVERGFSGMYVRVLARNPSRAFYERVGGVRLAVDEQVEIGGETLTHVAYGWAELEAACRGWQRLQNRRPE